MAFLTDHYCPVVISPPVVLRLRDGAGPQGQPHVGSASVSPGPVQRVRIVHHAGRGQGDQRRLRERHRCVAGGSRPGGLHPFSRTRPPRGPARPLRQAPLDHGLGTSRGLHLGVSVMALPVSSVIHEHDVAASQPPWEARVISPSRPPDQAGAGTSGVLGVPWAGPTTA